MRSNSLPSHPIAKPSLSIKQMTSTNINFLQQQLLIGTTFHKESIIYTYSLSLSRIDYCNSLLFGSTHDVTSHLQRIQNYAARVILRLPKSSSITIHLKSLHWLPVKVRSTYKIACLCYHCHSSTAPSCIRGAPWSAANRLHGQRTGAFSWRPVLGLFRKTDQFRLEPTQNCAPGWWCDLESSVYHLALEMYSGIFRHAINPLALSRMHTKHQLHPCPHPTHHCHGYHTHTPTVTNPTAFHAQL